MSNKLVTGSGRDAHVIPAPDGDYSNSDLESRQVEREAAVQAAKLAGTQATHGTSKLRDQVELPPSKPTVRKA